MAKDKGVTAPKGFRVGAAACGLKSTGAPDVVLVVSDLLAAWAGVFTRNRVISAPALLSKKRLARKSIRAIIANSGNANACTGRRGELDAAEMTRLAAGAVGLRPNEVIVASTGIIGEKLDMDKVSRGIAAAARNLGSTTRHAREGERAIMTTDLVAKSAVARFRANGKSVVLGGMAKGSGMIAPRMGTMHAFLVTDAAVESAALRGMLRDVVDETFNCVTVDGHTSTSDCVFLLANGASGAALRSKKDTAAFRDALREVARSLSRQIAADGEGARCLVTVEVTGARTMKEARMAARAIAESPLVKTAIHGADPNWGRIVSAAGYSGAAMNPKRAELSVQGVKLFARGEPLEFPRKRVSRLMGKKEVVVSLNLGAGRSRATFWTCDLSKLYIAINAEYHT